MHCCSLSDQNCKTTQILQVFYILVFVSVWVSAENKTFLLSCPVAFRREQKVNSLSIILHLLNLVKIAKCFYSAFFFFFWFVFHLISFSLSQAFGYIKLIHLLLEDFLFLTFGIICFESFDWRLWFFVFPAIGTFSHRMWSSKKNKMFGCLFYLFIFPFDVLFVNIVLQCVNETPFEL